MQVLEVMKLGVSWHTTSMGLVAVALLGACGGSGDEVMTEFAEGWATGSSRNGSIHSELFGNEGARLGTLDVTTNPRTAQWQDSSGRTFEVIHVSAGPKASLHPERGSSYVTSWPATARSANEVLFLLHATETTDHPPDGRQYLRISDTQCSRYHWDNMSCTVCAVHWDDGVTCTGFNCSDGSSGVTC